VIGMGLIWVELTDFLEEIKRIEEEEKRLEK